MAPESEAEADRDQEQTVDEYARSNGLTIDSYVDAGSLLSSFSDPSALLEALEEQGLRSFRIASFSLPLIERPSISKSALNILTHVGSRECAKSLRALILSESGRPPKRYRLELPLLKTDPEIDDIHLQQSIEPMKQIDFPANIPPVPPAEPLDPSQDESLSFPDSALDYRAHLAGPPEPERISISKGVLDCIRRVTQLEWTDTDMLDLFAEQIPPRSSRPRRLTPPLSPVEANEAGEDYFMPDPAACQIPIASDPSSLMSADLDAAEAALPRDSISPPETTAPLYSALTASPIRAVPRTKASELRLEQPLTPLEQREPLPVTIADLMQEYGDSSLDQLQLDSGSSPAFELESVLSDDLFQVLEDSAAHAKRSVEQEQLETVDATARIPIPAMDFTIPESDWVTCGQTAAEHFQWILQNHSDIDVPRWPEDPAARQRLQWLPFPAKLGRVNAEEKIDGPDILSLLRHLDTDDVPTSSNFIYKRPGISILRSDEEEDLLEQPRRVATSKMQQDSVIDLETLAAKRKREAKQNIDSTASASSSPIDLVMVPKSERPSELNSSERLLFDVDEPAAAATLLDNFVKFHNSKRRKLGTSTFFAKSTSQVVPVTKDKVTRLPKPIVPPQAVSQPTEKKAMKMAPSPALKAEGVPANIIFSIKINRGVVGWMEKLLPWVKITERDFDRYNKLIWDRRSVTTSPIISNLAAEADVIVSPSTGLVMLSLIKAIQRPIPGHKGKAAVREKIEAVSQRYERLIVLVSQGNRMNESLRAMTESECLGFSDFSGFVAGLDTNAQVFYVGGGEETLSRWLAYFITTYSYEAMKVDSVLIDTETTWELILRRAGMNAFAAQVILSELKEPFGVTKDDVAHRGLAAFVNMSPDERCAKFCQLLGGERVLRRVGAVLDSTWIEI